MTTYDLGSARGTVVIDYANTGAGEAITDIDKIKASAEGAGSTFEETASTIEKGGLTIIGALGLTVLAAAGFEKSMSGIQAVSGATKEEMALLSETALRLGADTSFGASEAAEGIGELVKAGVPIADILNGAADAAVTLAEAGGIALAEAAEIAAVAMNTFGLKGKDLGKVADLIAGAANASSISVGDFKQAMNQSGSAAALVGMSFEDLATAIAVMGKAGIKGSDAGTSLKTFLMNLQPVTDKQRGLMQDLGLVTKEGGNKFFDAAGNIKSMSEVAGILNDTLKDQTKEQKIATLETLFGSDALRAAAIIAKDGAKGFDDVAAAMGKVKAKDVAKIRMDNLSGDIERIKGSIETFAISMGKTLTPALRDIVKAGDEVIAKITGMSDETKLLIVDNAVLTAGIALTIGALGRLSGAIKGVFAAVKANPVTIALLAIVAIAIYAYKNFKPFRDLVNDTFAKWKAGAETVWPVIKKAFDEIVKAVTDAWTHIGPTVLLIVDILKNSLGGAIADVKAAFKEMEPVYKDIAKVLKDLGIEFSAVKLFLAAIVILNAPLLISLAALAAIVAVIIMAIAQFAAIMKLMSQAISFVYAQLKKLQPVWAAVAEAVSGAVTAIKDAVVNGFNIVKGAINSVLTWLTGFWKSIWGGLVGFVAPILEKIKSAITGTLATIRSVWESMWGFFGPFVKSIWNLISSIIGLAIAAIKFAIVNTLNNIKTVFMAAFNYIANLVRERFNFIKGLVTAAMTYLISTFVARWNAIKTLTINAWNAITGAIRTAFNAAKTAVSTIAGNIRSFLAGVWNGIIGNARSTISQLPSPFTEGVSKVVGILKGIPDRVKNALSGLGSILYSAGADAINGLLNGLKSRLGILTDIANTIADKVKSVAKLLKVDSPSKVMMDIGNDAVMGLILGMRNLIGDVEGVASSIAFAAQPQLAGMSAVGASGSFRANAAAAPTANAGRSGDTITINQRSAESAAEMLSRVQREKAWKGR